MAIGKMTKKNIASADEVRTFSKGKVELVKVGGVVFGKATFLPGWKWSDSVGPMVGTPSCMVPHTQYHLSGRLHVVMDDGSEEEFGPGDFGNIPPGHDAWVVGDEPAVVIDVTGMADYAKESPIEETSA
jgi:hypothetical protein